MKIIILLASILTAYSFAQTMPYPKSTYIDTVTWHWNTHQEDAGGTDNWPMTWSADGNQYTSGGDGRGFDDGAGYKASILVARIDGSKNNWSGTDVWYGAEGGGVTEPFDAKAYGIVSINDTMYMYAGPGSNAEDFDWFKVWSSTDRGASWTIHDNVQWRTQRVGGNENWILPTILQFGQDYSGARDQYIYIYMDSLSVPFPSPAAVMIPGKIHLMRVAAKYDSITDKSAYWYFSGTADSPSWTKDSSQSVAVFENSTEGVGWCTSGVQYFGGTLDRYILTAYWGTSTSDKNDGQLSIFEAPEPWGPWKTIFYNDFNVGPGSSSVGTESFGWYFAPKWIENDTSFVIIFSGVNDDDSFNSVEGSFTVSTADSTPPSSPTGMNATPVSDKQIDLVWLPSNDPESGISHYKVYRDGNMVGQPTSTFYNDTGLNENTTYTYQVSAVNGLGLESNLSSSVNATTLADTTPPTIVSASIGSSLSQVIVNYSEPVEQNSATEINNYNIDNGIALNLASLDTVLKTVNLGTSPHTPGLTYTITVNNVLDRATIPNPIAPNTQASYTVSDQINVTNLTVASGEPYGVANGLNDDSLVYMDRNYLYSNVPASITGNQVVYIRTANDDKFSQGNQFLSFDINQAASIYIAHDDRYQTKPDWLGSFTDTSQSLTIDNQQHTLFSKSIPGGPVMLGGNVHPSDLGDNNMYTVIIIAQSGGAPPPAIPTNLTITK